MEINLVTGLIETLTDGIKAQGSLQKYECVTFFIGDFAFLARQCRNPGTIHFLGISGFLIQPHWNCRRQQEYLKATP